MLGVIADHASPEHQPLPQWPRIHPAGALATEPFPGQPERVTHRGPNEQPSDPIHALRHSTSRASAILACSLGTIDRHRRDDTLTQ